jgi:hypothetical protein
MHHIQLNKYIQYEYKKDYYQIFDSFILIFHQLYNRLEEKILKKK